MSRASVHPGVGKLSGPPLLAESFQHSEEGGALRGRESFEAFSDHLISRVGHDVLVLQEPTTAVDAVPIAHPVEWMEEGRNRFKFSDFMLRCFAEPQFIEGAHGEAIQESVRDVGGSSESLIGRVAQRLTTLRVR